MAKALKKREKGERKGGNSHRGTRLEKKQQRKEKKMSKKGQEEV